MKKREKYIREELIKIVKTQKDSLKLFMAKAALETESAEHFFLKVIRGKVLGPGVPGELYPPDFIEREFKPEYLEEVESIQLESELALETSLSRSFDYDTDIIWFTLQQRGQELIEDIDKRYRLAYNREKAKNKEMKKGDALER